MGLLDGIDRANAAQGQPGRGGGGGMFGPFGAAIGGAPVVGGVAGGLTGLNFNRLGQAEELYGGVDPQGNSQRASFGAERFGVMGAQGYGAMGDQLALQRGLLKRQALGRDSLSAEQLRQSTDALRAQQIGMAAGAAPSNAGMAAREASLNSALIGGGLAGQQAIAGIQERQAAQQQLGALNLGQRQQDLNAALGGQQNAISGYGGMEQARTGRYAAAAGAPTEGEQILGGIGGLASLKTLSDRRAKTAIRDGDKEATALVRSLKPKTWRYKPGKREFGEGPQFGIMAQDLERTRAGRAAVVDTPHGKMIDGGKLATAIAATLPGLDRRLRQVERRGR